MPQNKKGCQHRVTTSYPENHKPWLYILNCLGSINFEVEGVLATVNLISKVLCIKDEPDPDDSKQCDWNHTNPNTQEKINMATANDKQNMTSTLLMPTFFVLSFHSPIYWISNKECYLDIFPEDQLHPCYKFCMISYWEMYYCVMPICKIPTTGVVKSYHLGKQWLCSFSQEIIWIRMWKAFKFFTCRYVSKH